MALSMMKAQAPRAGAFGTSCPRVTVRVAAPVHTSVCLSHKNGENVDMSKVPQYMRHPTDTGSPESQVARISARVQQLSSHMQANRKDNSAKRGLQLLLAERKKLLKYLYKENRDSFDVLVKDFSVRNVIANDTRGAAREKSESLPV